MTAGRPPQLGKLDIVKILARRFGYRTYLEITTGLTGGIYPAARRSGFETCRRIVYRQDVKPADDGEPVDYPVGGEDIADAIARIRADGPTFDVIMVDAHHTYACAIRDIAASFALVRDGGALVVHDCDPPDADLARPDFVEGPWCGVTYKAFLDFVRDNDDLFYVTVDTDYGCGVVFKGRRRGIREWLAHRRAGMRSAAGERALTAAWREVGDDFAAAFAMLRGNRKRLLRLMSPRRFTSVYGKPA
ncbi:class I SAM-dependent methyltransferase [Oricola sp.]|uniref:class I SAM-dependent methyltransferase n=1 Tax=Oricola sp. TaxID=1979950 RepID=UPI0025D90F2E|nr:class I SAM-dependent methyltransferase [Oricola sp.]MCI5073666.1 class I SAM-dependent methyltransferase [Oricola sp.]